MANRLHQGLVEDASNPGTFVADPVTLPTVPASPTNATAVDATAATNSSPYGFSQAQADAIVTQLNIVIAALIAAGFLS